MSTFAPNGYYRKPFGPDAIHRGATEFCSFFTQRFSAGGGIRLDPCAMTDDSVRCAVEYSCMRWARHDLRPDGGIAIYERNPEGIWPGPRI